MPNASTGGKINKGVRKERRFNSGRILIYNNEKKCYLLRRDPRELAFNFVWSM